MPRHDDDAGEPGDPPWLAPREEIQERLGAHDEEHVLARDAERLERVDGVRRARATQLKVGDGELRVPDHRELHHRVPVRRRGQVRGRLVRWDGGRHKEDPVEGEGVQHLVGEEEVPVVDRIERPAEDRRPGQA